MVLTDQELMHGFECGLGLLIVACRGQSGGVHDVYGNAVRDSSCGKCGGQR